MTRLCLSFAALFAWQSCSDAPSANRSTVEIAFSSSRSGNGDIYAYSLSDGSVRQLIQTEYPEGSVRYNRHRSKLVYTRFSLADDDPMVMSGDDTLFVDPNGDVPPVWSPADARLAYVARTDSGEAVFIAGESGESPLQITSDDSVARYPAWSPDGTELVYCRRTGDGWDLYRQQVLPSPGTPIRLTFAESYVGHPSWSHDGSSIAYDAFVDGQSEIFVLDLASGTSRRITSRPGNDLAPSWSPDDKQLVFGADIDNLGNWDVWLVHTDSLTTIQLTTSAAFDGGPVFIGY